MLDVNTERPIIHTIGGNRFEDELEFHFSWKDKTSYSIKSLTDNTVIKVLEDNKLYVETQNGDVVILSISKNGTIEYLEDYFDKRTRKLVRSRGAIFAFKDFEPTLDSK